MYTYTCILSYYVSHITCCQRVEQVFGLMERHKEQLFIEDYSVSQTTLEQVFINFARAQRPPEQDDISCLTALCANSTCCCCS